MSQPRSPLFAKQLALNRLFLPKEIISIIKDYAFNSIEAVAKQKKKNLVGLFYKSQYGRYPCKLYSEERQLQLFAAEQITPRKLFCFTIYKDTKGAKTKQFQACFCSRCGNYATVMDVENIPKKIICTDLCYSFRNCY
jgi:formylmethanofuran dehydrogenase subunit E